MGGRACHPGCAGESRKTHGLTVRLQRLNLPRFFRPLQALSKNGEYIGQRYVRLLHVPRAEMEEQVRLGTLAIPGAAAKIRSRMMRSQQRNMGYMAGPVQLMPSMMPGGRPVMGMGPPGGIGAPYGQTAGPGQTPVESRLW